MDELMARDDSLISAASVTPEPDQGCVTTCYYVGWEWDHKHGGSCAAGTELEADKTKSSLAVPC